MNTKNEKSIQYNEEITIETLERQEAIDPHELNLLKYSGPSSVCNDFPSGKLGNMAGGFHFNLLGLKWYSSEHLYLCGEWSLNDEEHIKIQESIRRQTSGDYAKRCTKSKKGYKELIRPDYNSIRHHWMLWCVWQKCLNNQKYADLLKSVPKDVVIVEEVKKDPVWAVEADEAGILRGANGMGKILTICRRCLIDGTNPEIDTDLLNKSGIYILGNKVEF